MDEDDEDPVPLPNVNAAILKKVITSTNTIFKSAYDSSFTPVSKLGKILTEEKLYL